MLAGFEVMFSASVVLSVPRPNAPLSLRRYHCLLHSVALRKVQSDMYIAPPVTATNDVTHNLPQQQNGSDCKDGSKLKWRS
jgi:hypothetical protein